MISKLIPVVALIVAIALLSIAMPAAHAQTQSEIESTVTIIAGTCGLETSTQTIDYGQVLPFSESDSRVLGMRNPGNTQIALQVSGSNWVVEASPGTILATAMPVDATRYSITDDPLYPQKFPLTNSLTDFATLDPLVIVDSFWQVRTNLLDETITGPITQTIQFTGSC